jgi:predicted ATPase
MLINRLEVKGFKSLKDVIWEPGALTILIGPNGSGKSNLLLSLEFLRSSALGALDKYIQQLGGVYSVFWDGEDQTLIFNANIDTSDYTLADNFFKTRYHLEISSMSWRNTYSITNEELIITTKDNNNTIMIYKDTIDAFYINNNNEKTNYPTNDTNFNHRETLLSKNIGTFENAQTNALINYCLASQAIHKDIITTRNAEIRRPLVTRFDKHISPDGQNLVNVLHTLYSENRDFENDINTAMRAAFGDDFDRLVFPPAADQLVQLRIRWKTLKREQSMLDLSDGTIRFLFLMTVLCNPEPAPLIAIDEPETGLHPSMFPIIAEYAAEASKRTQVIFSTHSPQFLDAFSDFDVTTTVTSWQDGETKIKNLDGDTLKDWLKHYSLGTLFTSGDLEALA